jgi:chitin synthase
LTCNATRYKENRAYDVNNKITPDLYELVLMVDADTKVMPDSLKAMSWTMANDVRISGLCGETRIANKSENWVTMIQVFEYYVSHFMSKSFESIFGGVTCLPGCFCMYRIKSPKHLEADGTTVWTPILCNPDILEAYSENIVETLHQKNLLLLGEDRYLSTLMVSLLVRDQVSFLGSSRRFQSAK